MSMLPSLSSVSPARHMWILYNDAMKEGASLVKNVIKLTGYSAFWTKEVLSSSAPAAFGQISGDMRHMKNAISAIAIPYKVAKVAEKVTKLCQEPCVKHACDAVGEVSGLVTEVDDAKGFVVHYLPKGAIPEKVMEGISWFSYASTVIGALGNIGGEGMRIGDKQRVLTQLETRIDEAGAPISDQAYAARKANTTNAIIIHLANLANRVSYFVLGIVGLGGLAVGAMGIAAAATTAAITTPIIVGCLTVATVLSLFSFFYERILDPEGKIEQGYRDQARLLTRVAPAA